MGNDCGRVASPDWAVDIVRMYTNSSGNTRFKQCTMQTNAPDGTGSVGEFSEMFASRNAKNTDGGLKVHFAVTRVPCPGDGQTILSHTALKRQLIVTLAGRMEFRSKDKLEAEQEDGVHKISVGPGDVLLAEDLDSSGHVWEFVPDADEKFWPWVRCYIHLTEEYNHLLSGLQALPTPALGWELTPDVSNQTMALLQSSQSYSSAGAVLVHMYTNKGGHTRFKRRLMQMRPTKGSSTGDFSDILVNTNDLGNEGDVNLQFAVTPAPKDGDVLPRKLRHVATRQLLIITLFGQMQFRSSTVSGDDEEHKALICPGDILLADNLDGSGYTCDFAAHADGNLQPWKRAYIQLGHDYDLLISSLSPAARVLGPSKCPTSPSCPGIFNQACPGGVTVLPARLASVDPTELLKRWQF